MHESADRRRRWWGMFFLVGALCLLCWGMTVLRGKLDDSEFVLYWLACFALAALAFFTALLDLWIIRRRARREHKELVRRLLENVPPLADRPEGGEPDSK